MSSGFIILRDLAAELQMDRSHLRRYVLKIGIQPVKIRTSESLNQKTLAVTEIEAERIRQERQRSGFSSSGKVESPALFGNFYLVVLDPEARPKRLKLGYSESLEVRMASYRTSNPYANLLDSWKCKLSWEQAAIAACVNVEGTVHILGEVYDVLSVDDTLNRARQFFDLVLPKQQDSLTGEVKLQL